MALSELQAQSLMVNAVRQHGGFAFKLSNRFLKGVPDLFIKLPQREPWFWEVKIQDVKDRWFKPALTPLQHKFLNDYEKRGGNAGVAMFIRGKEGLKLLLETYCVLGGGLTVFSDTAATLLPRGQRELTIFKLLSEVKYG